MVTPTDMGCEPPSTSTIASYYHTAKSWFLFYWTMDGGKRSLERQVGQWCVRAVSVKKQLQMPTTERVLLADLHAELRSLFFTSGKLAGGSLHVYNTHPDFRGVIMVKIVRIITEFLPDKITHTHTHTHTHTFNGPFSRTTRVSRYQKVKPIWILQKQETVSGSGISWAIWKSPSRSRQITMPVPHHSSFLQAGCPSCCPTNSVKALKARQNNTICSI